MAKYASHVSTRKTSQSQPVIGKEMVKNSAGGFTFQVDDWKQLERFLILGQEGPTYYASEKEVVFGAVGCLDRCAFADPVRTIKLITDISVNGRAPKNDPAIFALAYLAGKGQQLAALALDAMPKVCRTGTHLFQFVQSVQEFRGWGRALKRGVGNWYLSKTPEQLAHQVTKYQQRNGMSHRDVLRLSKPVTKNTEQGQVIRWAVGKPSETDQPMIAGFLKAKQAASPKEVAGLIREYNLPRECVPTQFLNSVEVWDALLEKMPMTAMVRNLGKMTAIGMLKPLSAASRTISERLHDTESLKKARVHPLQLLIAQRIYGQGFGDKGSLRWSPDQTIIQSLDDAFTLAFDAVVPAGKRFLLGLDVSGSMGSGHVAGAPLTPRDASAAMALVTMRTEPWTHVIGFTGRGFSVTNGRTHNRVWGITCGTGVEPLNLTAKMDLRQAIRNISGLPMGPTDCSLPMLYAMEQGLEVDTFVIYTDNETWHGDIHPFQALKQYRDKTGIPAKLVVVSMVPNNFSIADKDDFGMLDIVGLDTSTPAVISDFARNL